MSYKKHQNNNLVQGAMENNQNRQNRRNGCKNTTVIKNSGNSYVFVEAEASAKAFAKAFNIDLDDQEDNLVSGEMDEENDDCDCKWDSHY